MDVLRIGPDSHGRAVALGAERTIELALPETAGTGYRWELAPLPPGVHLLDDRVEVDSPRPGSSGTRIFTLSASVTGDCRLGASLRRSWEPGPVREFSVRLVL